jgi:NAD(P)-dependent dehydrogenase (short-subunit alcohol dehydrogenase family)
MQLTQGQVAVITGAASGIGQALAREAAERGLKLVLADVDGPSLDEATANLLAGGADAIAVPTDVRDAAAVEALRDAALSAYGAVHLVCNNAGVAAGGRTWEVELEVWRWILDVDLWSVIHGVRTFVPLLVAQDEGHVLNTASLAGLTTIAGLAPYTVAKHGVVALTETLHNELRDTNVGVSVLCPGFVRTRIHELDRLAPDEVRAARPDRGIEEGPSYGAFREMIEAGIDPALVAAQALDAVHADQLHILTPPDVVAFVTERMQKIVDSPAVDTRPRSHTTGAGGPDTGDEGPLQG